MTPVDSPDRSAPDYWQGRAVTVMGLGLFGGGAGVARWFAEHGARVTVTDLRGADELAPSLAGLADLDLRLVLDGHAERDFVNADCVVANAAVPPNNPFLALAREHGVEVATELGLFLEWCQTPQIWVSGTQGKSSTAHILAELLEGAGRRVRLAGNIGRSLLAELDPRLADIIVVEVSSYQLECLPPNLDERRPDSKVETVILTNVLADHLERHGTVEAYVEAKARLLSVLQTGGNAILPAADRRLRRRAPRDCRIVEHAPNSESELGLRAGRFALGDPDLASTKDLHLPGSFQVANALPALGAAHLAGVPASSLGRTLPNLRGLPHRMEELGSVGGRRVIDNGVSTTPDSTLAVLESVEGGCTLLLGGRTKRGLGFEELAARAASRSSRVVAFGHGRDGIQKAFEAVGVETYSYRSMEDAVACALRITPAGETVLFSPAAASFDAYSNFKQRARAFRAALERVNPADVHEPSNES